MKREEIELLAPAGSYEGFEAAIGAGADAVYVGGAAFGARAYAKNFGEEELLRAIDTAHLHGKKLYLTVNTLLKNRELTEQLYDYLLPYYKEGLDAVIVRHGRVRGNPGTVSGNASACEYADDSDWSGRDEISGRTGSLPRGNCQRAVSGGNPTDA